MTVLEQLRADMITALKARESEKKSFIGFVIGEVTKESKSPDDNYVISKIKKLLANAKELGQTTEVEVLEKYVPAQLSADKLTSIVSELKETDGLTPKDMGKVMGHFKTNYAGLYDGRVLSGIVREVLA